MSVKQIVKYSELRTLILNTLRTDEKDTVEQPKQALIDYLTKNSNLPGPRMNTALVAEFATRIGELLLQPDIAVERMETLLDQWATLSLTEAPINDPREMLPAVAVLSYGQAGVVRPEWWEDETAKLRKAASSPRWRTREIVAAALQRLLKADWPRAINTLTGWLADDDPLVLRAAAAGVAEPPLLTNESRGTDALLIQIRVTGRLLNLPESRRREESVRVLRQALGYTLSVAVAASPLAGFELLEKFAISPDRYVRQLVQDNLKKSRLQSWPDRIAVVQRILGDAGDK